MAAESGLGLPPGKRRMGREAELQHHAKYRERTVRDAGSLLRGILGCWGFRCMRDDVRRLALRSCAGNGREYPDAVLEGSCCSRIGLRRAFWRVCDVVKVSVCTLRVLGCLSCAPCDSAIT
jgi:hypothetical protein